MDCNKFITSKEMTIHENENQARCLFQAKSISIEDVPSPIHTDGVYVHIHSGRRQLPLLSPPSPIKIGTICVLAAAAAAFAYASDPDLL